MNKPIKSCRGAALGALFLLCSCTAQLARAQGNVSQPATGSTPQPSTGPFSRKTRPLSTPSQAPAAQPPIQSTIQPVPDIPAPSLRPPLMTAPATTAAPSAAAAATASGAYKYCNQAFELSGQGQYNEAAQAFSSALTLDHNMLAAYLGRAFCYYQLGRNEEALNDCNAAIQLDPSSANAYAMRGTVYNRLQQFNEALADHTKALELNGGKDAATANDLLSQSIDLYAFKQYHEAIDYASRAIAKDPNNDRAYDIRGMAYSEANDTSAAMSDFNRAISMAPDNPDYRCHRGITEIKLGKLDDAMADLTFAINRRNDFGIAFYDRGIVYMLQGNYGSGLKDIQEAIRTDHRFALARYEFKQDKAKGKRHDQMKTPEDYYYRACTRILTIKNDTSLSDLHHYLSKTKWQGPLAPAAVVAIYLGEMRNHNTGSAQNVLKKAETRCNKSVWPYPVIRYLHNEIPITDLLAQANNQDQLSDAHAYAGLSEVFSGANSAVMNPHLEWIKTYGSPSLVSYDMAIQQTEKETFTGPKGSQLPLP